MQFFKAYIRKQKKAHSLKDCAHIEVLPRSVQKRFGAFALYTVAKLIRICDHNKKR